MKRMGNPMVNTLATKNQIEYVAVKPGSVYLFTLYDLCCKPGIADDFVTFFFFSYCD